MASSVTTTANGVVVITHVFPPGSGSGSPNQQVRHGDSSAVQMFRKYHPQALGTVQILIGAMVLLFGVVMTFSDLSLGVVSGIFVWGSIIYIIAGSLTVASGTSSNQCLIGGALGMNVTGAVASITAFILYCMDAAGVLNNYCYGQFSDWVCEKYMIQNHGVSGVLAVFSLLQFIISICVAAFACRAQCCCSSKLPDTITNQFADVSTVATHNYETIVNAQTPSNLTLPTPAALDDLPPLYTMK